MKNNQVFSPSQVSPLQIRTKSLANPISRLSAILLIKGG